MNVHYTFGPEDLRSLLSRTESPCVSIYLPTHRRKTEGRGDAILYKNLCREVERVLERDMPGPAARAVRQSLTDLDTEEFWDEGHPSDGLAVFANPGFVVAYRLPGHLPQLEVVGGSFHTKPLLRFLQSNSHSYYVLAVGAQRTALYSGMGDSLHPVPMNGVTQSLDEDRDGTDGAKHRGVDRSGDRTHYGQGGPKEQAKADLEKLFRVVAKDVWRVHLRASPRPVVLAAQSHHQPIFRKVAEIPTLLEKGISADPSKLTPEELKIEALRVLEPALRERIAAACDEFGAARARSMGSGDIKDVARAVVSGRVKMLLVESGRRVWGLLEGKAGTILPGDSSKNAYDVDLLDELAEQALSRGAEVFVLDKQTMPTESGVAAVYRY